MTDQKHPLTKKQHREIKRLIERNTPAGYLAYARKHRLTIVEHPVLLYPARVKITCLIHFIGLTAPSPELARRSIEHAFQEGVKEFIASQGYTPPSIEGLMRDGKTEQETDV